MAASEGSPALISLKNSLQSVKKDRDRFKEQYTRTVQQLDSERSRRDELKGEAETLHVKIREMDEAYQQMLQKQVEVSHRVDEATKLADETERARRALDHRRNMDEDRIANLEQMIKDAQDATVESDRKFEEVSRKLLIVTADKERKEAKTEEIEVKSKGTEEEIHVITSKLKALEGQIEQFVEREEKYERTLSELNARIKNAENRGSDADQTVKKLDAEISQLKGELDKTKNQYQTLRDELDPFAREIAAV